MLLFVSEAPTEADQRGVVPLTALALPPARPAPAHSPQAAALDAARPSARSVRQLSHRQCHARTITDDCLYINSRPLSMRVCACSRSPTPAAGCCGRRPHHPRRSVGPSHAAFYSSRWRADERRRTDGRGVRRRSRPQRIIGPPPAHPTPRSLRRRRRRRSIGSPPSSATPPSRLWTAQSGRVCDRPSNR